MLTNRLYAEFIFAFVFAVGYDDGTDCEYEETSAVKPGTYYFQASVIQIRPTNASAESKKIKIVITK